MIDPCTSHRMQVCMTWAREFALKALNASCLYAVLINQVASGPEVNKELL